jgi:hypothetical protein
VAGGIKLNLSVSSEADREIFQTSVALTVMLLHVR